MTVRSAISQGEPIFAGLARICEDRKPGTQKHLRYHVILIDTMETIDGEEHIVYWEPHLGQVASVSWKDFLEVWDGTACIPAEQTSP